MDVPAVDTGAMGPPPPQTQAQQLQQAHHMQSQPHQHSVSPTTAATTDLGEETRRIALVKEFTSHLGVSVDGSASQARAKPELARYLYRNPSDPTGGAICSLPGLELSSEDDDQDMATSGTAGDGAPGGGGGGGLLPDVGASAHMHPTAAPYRSDSSVAMPPPPPKQFGAAAGAGGGTRGGPAIPAMAAAVFDPNNTADAVTAANTAANAMPGSAASGMSAAVAAAAGQSPEAASANAAKLEAAAAANLGTPTTWTRSSVAQAPPSIVRSLSSSFYSLLDSRVRAWTLLLLRHSLSSGDDDSRSRLLALLATSSAIDLSKIVMSFQTLDLPPAMKAQLEQEKRAKAAAREAGTLTEAQKAERDCDLVLPLIFEANIDVNLQGQTVSVQLRAPGTVGGEYCVILWMDWNGTHTHTHIVFHGWLKHKGMRNIKRSPIAVIVVVTILLLLLVPSVDFVSPSSHIKYLEIKLDTNSLVASMVEKARLVVFKAVARATSIQNTSASKAPTQSPGQGLASFSSALSLGGEGGSSLQRSKASASAQRLQDIMTRKVDTKATKAKDDTSRPTFPTLGKTRKNRSVTWNNQVEQPRTDSRNWPDNKRRKMSQTLAPTLKRSYKSFGKPHADDSDSSDRVKNSTFAEFGHAHKHANVPTFRNGRLHMPSANRQGPMDGGGMGRSMGNLSSTQGNANWGGGGGNATFGNAGFGQQQQGFGSSAGMMQQRQQGFGLSSGSTGGSSVDRFGLTRRGSGGNMNMGGSGGGGGGGGAPGMPRTATALESMLLSGVTPGSSGGGGNASFGAAAAPGGNFGGLRRN